LSRAIASVATVDLPPFAERVTRYLQPFAAAICAAIIGPSSRATASPQ